MHAISNKIHIFYPELKDLEFTECNELPPWYFNNGRRAWLLQTFLELKSEHPEITIGNNIPIRSVVIFHRTDYETLLKMLSWNHRIYLVCIRADKPECKTADTEVVQNRTSVSKSKHRFMPHWPQPGLIPRDSHRGNTIKQAGFKGSSYEIHPELISDNWKNELSKRSVVWSCSPLPPKKLRSDTHVNDWHDFSSMDVIVAIRGADKGATKPATKLVNSWLAGVPAILGPEPAYQELKKSEFDYLEASSPLEALKHLDKLLADPVLYKKMRDNCFERAKNFDRNNIKKTWNLYLKELEEIRIKETPFLIRNFLRFKFWKPY